MTSQRATFYEYSACGTCKKARAWLDRAGIGYEPVPIVEAPPTLDRLRALVAASGLPTRKWINTSGQSYRALIDARGKQAVQSLSDDELLRLLAADGKLIKRPVLVTDRVVLVGFREEQYATLRG